MRQEIITNTGRDERGKAENGLARILAHSWNRVRKH